MVQERKVFACVVLQIVTCWLYGILWQIAIADDISLVSGTKDRGGMGVALLTIFTCGIYGFYWAYQCGKKVDRLRQERGIPSNGTGILYLILYIFGGIIVHALIQHELNNAVYTRSL